MITAPHVHVILDGVQITASSSLAEQWLGPALREGLPAFLDEQVRLRNLRESTARAYKNLLTREEIGAVLLDIRRAGKSSASVEQIRCPLTRFYAWQINVHRYQGSNPAGDLKFFIGRQPSKRSRKRDLQWFPQKEAQTLLEACHELKPRWYAFLMVGFGSGLRWGEIAGLDRHDIDWARRRLHVQRTWSEDGGRIEGCKDGENAG